MHRFYRHMLLRQMLPVLIYEIVFSLSFSLLSPLSLFLSFSFAPALSEWTIRYTYMIRADKNCSHKG